MTEGDNCWYQGLVSFGSLTNSPQLPYQNLHLYADSISYLYDIYMNQLEVIHIAVKVEKHWSYLQRIAISEMEL